MKDKKVLLVEDDEHNAMFAVACLKKLWIDQQNITTCTNWLDALDEIKKNLFDIIIMDLKLPWADGIHLTKKIRDNHDCNQPLVIAYTADILSIKNESIKQLMDWFILKPSKLSDFEHHIKKSS